VTTLDFAKALIDEGYHPMTIYFTLIVHGAMLIEPTETESKASLDLFVEVLKALAPERRAPARFPVSRLLLSSPRAAASTKRPLRASRFCVGAGAGASGGSRVRRSWDVARSNSVERRRGARAFRTRSARQSVMTPRKLGSSPIMRSTRHYAATNIRGWRSSSTFPSTGASSARADRCVFSAKPMSRHSTTAQQCWHARHVPCDPGAIEKAATRGVAIIGVTNSWMSGRSAYYVEMIAKADLAGIHTASSARSVAPFGGARAALGTQSDRLRMPSSQGPVVFDMGTSAFMGTDRAFRERLGQLLPEGVAVDAEGRPTRDPAMARLGALLPFGGYKGFGLSAHRAGVRCAAGSALDPDKDDGYLFVVFKPDLLVDLDDFKQQVSELIDRVKATPRQPGVSEIRIPGERALRSRERALREGIEVDSVVYEALAALHV